MSKRSDSDCLRDIAEALRRIGDYVAGLTSHEFMEDKRTQDAVGRNLEVMGEATKNLSKRLRDAHPNVPWKDMAGVRDKVIHHYFGINLEIVWEIAKGESPELLRQIGAIHGEQEG